MSNQPNEQKKPDDPIRRCDVLIGWVWTTILVIWVGWGFLVPLVLMVAAANAGIQARQSHDFGGEDHTYHNLTTAVVNAALKSTGACIALPATLLLVVIWLQLRRLRKRIAQDY